MNLYQVIRAIERTAAGQPPVRSIVRNDIFRLNALPDVPYGTFAWLQGEHSTEGDSDLIRWSFTFFYVDRLTANHDNEVQVQSTGIEVLENILQALQDGGIFAGEYTFQTFNQRFADECAGVFCRVVLEAPKGSTCAEQWDYEEGKGDFNLDYNEDFKCWVLKTKEREIYIY